MAEAALRFDPVELPPETEAMRERVRAFIAAEVEAGSFVAYGGGGFSARHAPEFSRRCGAAGFIGMTWPAAYGGGEHSFLERYVVTEELLAVGAPVWAHWVADRQSGPVLLRFAHPSLRDDVLPRIAAGECYFCIGMSEPDSGSDLFSLRSKAERVADGWCINGRKIWTSNAHRSHYMIALLRTAPATDTDRRHGLSQFLIPMDTAGITVNPILNMTGGHDFNEVVFDDVVIPDHHLLGEVDMGWKQATGELAYERSGPERFLDTFSILYELVRAASEDSGPGSPPGERQVQGIGRLVAQLSTLRHMSLSVAGMLQSGQVPEVESSVVKELGTNWEQALPGIVRDLAPLIEAEPGNRARFEEVLRANIEIAPKLTIQGGTREILRGIIARGLGLR